MCYLRAIEEKETDIACLMKKEIRLNCASSTSLKEESQVVIINYIIHYSVAGGGRGSITIKIAQYREYKHLSSIPE